MKSKAVKPAKAGKTVNAEQPKQTPAEIMEEIIFAGAEDAESRVDKLEVWRSRSQATDQHLFEPDVMRLVKTAITNWPVEVVIPIRLSAMEWQRLIAAGIDEARERFLVNSPNRVNDQWKVPAKGADGVLGDIVTAAIRKAMKGVAQ